MLSALTGASRGTDSMFVPVECAAPDCLRVATRAQPRCGHIVPLSGCSSCSGSKVAVGGRRRARSGDMTGWVLPAGLLLPQQRTAADVRAVRLRAKTDSCTAPDDLLFDYDSITSSARLRSGDGIVIPIALAVLRL